MRSFFYITDRDEFVTMWERGDTTIQMAAHYGVTKGAVSAAARRYGLPLRPLGRKPVEAVWHRRAEADALRAQGLSLAEIARLQGISHNLAKQDAFQFRRAA